MSVQNRNPLTIVLGERYHRYRNQVGMLVPGRRTQ
jgi:protein-S-isoprenylcysteine O-methyltransferase Ste14